MRWGRLFTAAAAAALAGCADIDPPVADVQPDQAHRVTKQDLRGGHVAAARAGSAGGPPALARRRLRRVAPCLVACTVQAVRVTAPAAGG